MKILYISVFLSVLSGSIAYSMDPPAISFIARPSNLEELLTFQGDDNGNTALMARVLANCIEKVEETIQAKPLLINNFNNKGETALTLAATHGYLPIIILLAHAGALLDIQNLQGESALHLGAQYDETGQIVKFLLQHGATITLKDMRHNTALSLAIQKNNRKNIVLLLAAGAEFIITSNTFASIKLSYFIFKSSLEKLLEAVKTDNIQLLKSVIKVIPLSILDSHGKTLLHRAVIHNSYKCMFHIVLMSPSLIAMGDYKGKTPIDQVFISGNNIEKIIQFFIAIAYDDQEYIKRF